MTSNELGEFLRASRARRRPEDAGLPWSGRRNVPGLRREEVAVLAGMNGDYYTRLEQGRERNPSAQVVDALSRAFDLDADVREHLHRLAGVAPGEAPAVEVVSPSLRQLMDGYPHTPAIVLGRSLDVLAANAPAEALFSPFTPADNLARMTFLDPAARGFYPRWEWVAQSTVATLRLAAGYAPNDVRLLALVERLREHSEDFRRLWSAHEVRGKTREAKDMVHPEVGALRLTYEAFDVRAAPGQQLVIYHAEPGSRSAEALTLLAARSSLVNTTGDFR